MPISTTYASTLKVYDGGMATGGGGAVVCRNSNYQVTSAELYDLFEARMRHGVIIDTQDTDPTRRIKQILTSLLTETPERPVPFIGNALGNRLDDGSRQIKFIPSNYKLKAPEDLGRDWGVILPIGCELEGAAYFSEDGTIEIARGVYDKLSPTDRTALFLHEVLYWFGRTYTRQQTSGDVRPLVALALSKEFSPLQWEKRISDELLLSDLHETLALIPLLIPYEAAALPIQVSTEMLGVDPHYWRGIITWQARRNKSQHVEAVNKFNPNLSLPSRTELVKISLIHEGRAGREQASASLKIGDQTYKFNLPLQADGFNFAAIGIETKARLDFHIPE